MAGFDNALGISPQVLAIRAQRMNLLASNIANADTPGYKARDIDFRQTLAAAQSDQSTAQLRTTDSRHIGFNTGSPTADVKYRVPSQLSLNGNTVEPHQEHQAFMENAMQYQASLNLLDSRIKGLMSAIKGGQ